MTQTHEIDERIKCCPECEESHITRRFPEKPEARNDGNNDRWRCKQCTATFDQPDERPREKGRGRSARGTVARMLEDADPETVP